MDSTVSGNSAPFGGGISNREGSLTVIDSNVLENSADGCRGVGAVLCSGGGGIWNSGMLTMENSTVSGSSSDWGGGIFNRGVREPTITNSTVSGNSAGFDGGGLLNFETLTLINSTVADNSAGQSGGGIANEAGILEVANSTLSGNIAASAGGGLYNPGGASAQLVNSTLSANTADTWGGGIYTGGELLLASSTIAANDAPTASAIYDPSSPGPRLRSIANTLIEGDCADSPPFDSDGYNIESPGNTCGFSQETDRPAEPQLNLGPLEDNGGPTRTHALLENSVAIDRIPEADCVDGGRRTVESRPAWRAASGGCELELRRGCVRSAALIRKRRSWPEGVRMTARRDRGLTHFMRLGLFAQQTNGIVPRFLRWRSKCPPLKCSPMTLRGALRLRPSKSRAPTISMAEGHRSGTPMPSNQVSSKTAATPTWRATTTTDTPRTSH